MSREHEAPMTMQERLNRRRQIYSPEYCLHAEAGVSCSGNIIRAHTIQRNGGLSKISRNGHMYSFLIDDASIMKTGQFGAKLVGVKSASTFTGFCGYHDKTTFAPIEDFPFQSTRLHTFLLAYRAICREIFVKKSSLDEIPLLRLWDRGRNLNYQIWLQNNVDMQEAGTKAAIREMTHYKHVYDTALLSGDFSGVEYYVININTTPEFLCSGAFFPQYDFGGNQLQDLMILDGMTEQITLSIIPTDAGGAIVFSWVGKSKIGKAFLQSLDALSDVALPNAIARLAFDHFENIFMSPVWWEGLDPAAQTELLKRQMSGTVVQERTPHYLKDDTHRVIFWSITSRDTNINFAV